jgi:hypothetical protein
MDKVEVLMTLGNTAKKNVNEKRSMKRRHLIYYLRIFVQDTNQMLGHLVDITPGGVMCISEELIESGKNFKLRMLLPSGIYGRDHLDFEAESRWSKRDINPDFFDTGFQFTLIDPKDQEIINHLIEEYGFND